MNLKELLDIAKSELQAFSTLNNPDFRLEQAVYKEDDKVWEIVVSFLVENTNKPIKQPFVGTVEFQFLRLYKRLLIDQNKKIVGLFIFNSKE